MGKLIIVVGNTGTGKTTLVRILSEQMNLISGLEENSEHPFQILFKNDPRYALPNQVDYLLKRAEQETNIRNTNKAGILDGGMEMDFLVFSHLFYRKGWLNDAELSLLNRLYVGFRTFLPPPDVIIHMVASTKTIMGRFERRDRPLEIATLDDVHTIDELLRKWLAETDPDRIINLDADFEDASYSSILPGLKSKILEKLGDL